MLPVQPRPHWTNHYNRKAQIALQYWLLVTLPLPESFWSSPAAARSLAPTAMRAVRTHHYQWISTNERRSLHCSIARQHSGAVPMRSQHLQRWSFQYWFRLHLQVPQALFYCPYVSSSIRASQEPDFHLSMALSQQWFPAQPSPAIGHLGLGRLCSFLKVHPLTCTPALHPRVI